MRSLPIEYVLLIPVSGFSLVLPLEYIGRTYPTRTNVLTGLAQPFVSDLGIRVSQLLTVPLSSSAAAIP